MSGTEDSKDTKGKSVDKDNSSSSALTAARFKQELMNAPSDVQDKLRALLQQMALGAGGAAAPGRPAGLRGERQGDLIILISPASKFYLAKPCIVNSKKR